MAPWQRFVLTGLVSLSVAACGGDDDGGGGPTEPTPDFTLSVSPTAVTVEAGEPAAGPAAAARRGSADIQVTVSRSGGFTGPVTVTVEGLPSGVTASPLTIDGGQTSGSVTLTASSSASAGGSTLTVRGSASGIADKTATVALTVEVPEPPPSGSIAISLSASSVSVTQGQSTTTTVTVARTDFTGAVSFSASSDPAGVETSFDPASTPGESSTLTISAGASLSPGSYTVTVTASGDGVDDATATVSVTVNQSSTGGSIQITYCESSGGIPDWFAVQDGGGAWTQVTEDPPGTFSFDLTSESVGLAWVIDGATDPQLQVFYASRQEIEAVASGQCEGTGLTKTVMGSVAGLGATEQATINMGGAFASAGLGQTQFTLDGVRDGTVDLLAAAVEFQTQTVTGMIIRRNLNPTDGSTLDVLDFGSGEAFAPSAHTVTVENTLGDQVLPAVLYVTENGAISSAFFQSFGGNQFFGVPADQQAAGDLHWLTVTAFPGQTQSDNFRQAARFFQAPADQTVTLGPVLNDPTVTIASTTPYVRPRMELAVQPEYDNFFILGYTQSTRTSGVLVLDGFDVGSTLDLTVPDFTSVAGWNNDWGLQPGSAVEWFVQSTGWMVPGIGGQPGFEDGNVTQSAAKSGTVNP